MIKNFDGFVNESKYAEFIDFYNSELQDIEDKRGWIDDQLSDPSNETWELEEYRTILKDLSLRERELIKRIKNLGKK